MLANKMLFYSEARQNLTGGYLMVKKSEWIGKSESESESESGQIGVKIAILMQPFSSVGQIGRRREE